LHEWLAEHLSALKTQFINNMSHELRTPLYHVIGLSTLSQRVNDLEKAKDYAQKIRVAGERLLGIVSSVLDFSAVESGDLQVRNDAFDLPLLLVYLTERFTEKANAKGLIFEIQRPELISQTMTGDARRLQQVLEELLGNAVKFTEQGKVIFAVVPGANRIEFVVSDSGVGMTTEQLNAGFKPFQQGDGSAQRRFGGLGLGLALTEHLAKLMGGQIAVSSKVGEGSTFRLTLPMNN
jgi:signal transduction histidine kinase